MKNSLSKIRILLVDDIDEFRDSFIYRNENDEFEINADKSLEQAEQRLRADFYSYDFIILDARGHIRAGMGDQEGQEGHVYLGIEKVKELSRFYGKSLPYCVYTGQSGSLEALQQMQVPVFLKTEDDAAMFDYIRSQHKQQPEATFRMKHPEIAKAFQKQWLTHDIEQDLIKLFGEMEAATPSDAKHAARRVRVIMEAVYIKIAQTSPSVLPNELTTSNDLALSNAIWKVAGQPSKDNNFNPPHAAMPIPLYNMVSSLQRATSRSAMHHYSSPISRYSLASYANILADLLLWFSNFMQKRA